MASTSSQRGKKVKGTVGVLGFVATVASIWWFAFRPRQKNNKK
ncbi:MAG: hypothetical protein WCJ82_03145 [Actinomycetota bacterium]|jgi:hypothetical protein